MGSFREEWEAAKQQRDQAKAALSAAQGRVASRFAEVVYDELGVKPGVVVESRGTRFLVVSVEVRDYDPAKSQPWLKGRAFKKDGAPGSREVPVYNGWKLIPAEQTT